MDRTVNPAMVTLARESLGWSQSDLAGKLGIPQGKISRYENGIAAVGDDDLRALCRATNYTEEFFFLREEIYGLGSSFLFHRKRQKVPIGVQKRIQASINVLRLQVQRLLVGAELGFARSFDVVSEEEVAGKPERAAELVRAAWRLPLGPVQNLTNLVESAGGIVMKCDFDTPLIDAAHFWLPGMPPLFFMNRDLPWDRWRWTLAHEIGHAVLHRHYAGENVEDEADRFAGEFLMPKREVISHLPNMTLERAAKLKPYWKVSMAALIRQAYRHKCITQWKYTNLNISLSSEGYKKVEPFPLEPEEPKLLKDIYAMHRTQLNYNGFDMAKLLYRRDDPQYFEEGSRPQLFRYDDKDFFAFPASA